MHGDAELFSNKIGTAGGSPHGPYAAACPEAIDDRLPTRLQLSGSEYLAYKKYRGSQREGLPSRGRITAQVGDYRRLGKGGYAGSNL